ncbi:zinc finger and BTB domain-containing protein 41 [Stomoxys calcitrans]|uniref:zinc finger and BTB domain-containing protein 41 n=1 Tax=Stomoxys calcitrans TaxID=35570 RepID=UPI0027E29683|nr:zinc finger and BTB domain-containing protein 41 [Stomoxys calcitrans]
MMTSIDMEQVEACRTCGVYYMSTANCLLPLFQNAVDSPEMMLIRLELAQWKIDISEHDGLSQYLCFSCLHEFKRIFKFRTCCTETQGQLRAFYNFREYNLSNVKVKTEIIEPQEKDFECSFIYVDDLSDEERDTVTPFNIPHVPIKEELIEEAAIPRENESSQIPQTASTSLSSSRECSTTAQGFDQATAEPHESKTIETLQQQQPPPFSTVECQLCQHLSPNQAEHKQHLQRVHEIRDLECHICGKVFKNSTPSRYKFHLKWHNINKHVKCTQCGFVCSSRQALKEHRRAVHAKIICKICGIGILAKKMKSHLREHEVLSQFPCEYCTEIFQSNEDRETHIWQVHADDQHAETDSSNVLSDQHELSKNTGEVEVVHVEMVCAHCNQKFAQESELKVHVQEQHRPKQQQLTVREYEKRLQDQSENVGSNDRAENSITIFEDYDDDDHDAGLQYVSSSKVAEDNNSIHFTHYRNDHSRNLLNDSDDVAIDDHTNQKSAEEQTLGKMDTSIEPPSDTEDTNSVSDMLLSQHQILKPFACANCTDTFATVEELLTHSQKHPKEQIGNSPAKSKFHCDTCGKQFDLKFSLNRHMKRHNKSS